MNGLKGEGEVELKGGSYPLVIDMDALARIGAAINSATLGDVLGRLVAAEPRAVAALLASRAHRDLREAVTSLADVQAIGEAAAGILTRMTGGKNDARSGEAGSDEGDAGNAESRARRKA